MRRILRWLLLGVVLVGWTGCVAVGTWVVERLVPRAIVLLENATGGELESLQLRYGMTEGEEGYATDVIADVAAGEKVAFINLQPLAFDYRLEVVLRRRGAAAEERFGHVMTQAGDSHSCLHRGRIDARGVSIGPCLNVY